MMRALRQLRRLLRPVGIVVLSLCLLVSALPPAQAADTVTEDTTIRVGLTVWADAVSSVSLTADGFVLGYYDEGGVFTAAAQTDASALTVTYYAAGTVSVRANGTLLGRYPDDLAVLAADGGAVGYGGNAYLGALRFSAASGALQIINYLLLDDYVQGVLPYEMYVTWPLEALKAGAVAARTYAASCTKHQEEGYDVCTSTCCQVYYGVYTGEEADTVRRAAEETAGICAYYDGELIEALYHASSGGATEDSENVWSTALPYLRGKTDPYDQMGDNPYTGWSYSFSAQELTALLRQTGADCATVTGVAVTAWTGTGNVAEVTFTDAAGKTYVFTGNAVRTVFLASDKVEAFSRNFTITAPGTVSQTGSVSVLTGSGLATGGAGTVVTAQGTALVSGVVQAITGSGTVRVDVGEGGVTNLTDQWVITGCGYGHGAGMSQWGACNMALAGYTYDEILKFYYTGITLE